MPSVPQSSNAPAASPEDLTFDFDEEVRLAVVMYGGVSLAIYMYGVAEELWRLVRATCPEQPILDPLNPRAHVRTYPDESTEPVYREVARARGEGSIRSRFVVDIVSGTSAGGINGIFLAAALANDTPLSALKKMWIEEGDIDVLVNDELSRVRDAENNFVDGFQEREPPRSLLNGRRMLYRLIEALNKVSRPQGYMDSPLVDELDLWVTTTDLDGLELPIRITNATARERRFANRYQFRFSRVFGVNDFTEDAAPFVAYAARSTSAFPFAFEPIRLATMPPFAQLSDEWSRFYPDYLGSRSPGFAARAFSDGGILDNKPFSHATETLVRRRAVLPVDRKLIYIEPDPGSGAGATKEKDWNAIDTSQAALMDIPRSETIRQDIQDVVSRNRELNRVRQIIVRAGNDADEHARLLALLPEPDPQTFATMTLRDMLAGGEDQSVTWGPSYPTYYRLKVAATIDYLAQLVARAVGVIPKSDEAWAVRQLVAAWKTSHYVEEPSSPDLDTDNAFFLHYGLPYRIRRITFVYGKLKDLQSGSPSTKKATLAAAGIQADELPPNSNPRAIFASARLGLAEALDSLYAVELLAGGRGGPIAQALAGAGLTRGALNEILDARDDKRADVVAMVLEEHGAAVTAAAEAVKDVVASAAAAARKRVQDVLGEQPFAERQGSTPQGLGETLSHILRFYYDAFEAYDLVLYPIQYATPLGETNPVEIIRISPADARALDDLPTSVRELKGQGLHHFAAFLDGSWRRHDMVWGRLHGAECLIRALAPPAAADDLVRKAHDRILSEYSEEISGAREADPRTWFANYNVSTVPSPEPTGTLRRSAPVIGTIVEDILNRRSGIAASAWNGLRRILPDQPGGHRAVIRLLRLLAAKWPDPSTAIVVLFLFAIAGGVLIAVLADSGGWRAFGILMAGAALVTVAVVLVALWRLVSTVRSFLARKVQAFMNLQPPGGTAVGPKLEAPTRRPEPPSP